MRLAEELAQAVGALVVLQRVVSSLENEPENAGDCCYWAGASDGDSGSVSVMVARATT